MKIPPLKVFCLVLILICVFAFGSCKNNSNESIDTEVKAEILLTLYGEKETAINYGRSYIDEGVYAVENGIDVSEEVKVKSDLDTNKIGNYTIVYKYKDEEITRNIKVIDSEPPSIKLIGDKHIYIAADIEYVEQGCIAVDNYDGDISELIQISDDINIDVIGDYTITYEIADSSKNAAQISRKVSVVDSPLSKDLADFTLDGLSEDTIIPETILSEEEIEKYMEETIVIGDSRACCFIWHGFISSNNVFGNSSLHPMNILERPIIDFNTDEEMLTLDFLNEHKPKRVIFSMGVDSVGGYPTETVIEEYRKFLIMAMEASPETIFIVHNIMPVSGDMDDGNQKPWKPTNAKINTMNYYLVQMCEDIGLKYLDSHMVLKSEYGHGLDWYFQEDNIHLSRTGQREVYKYIISHPLVD